ncbi:MAG: hypothetical protein ABII01_04225 [Candidatus Woesearchaeota archaeon]
MVIDISERSLACLVLAGEDEGRAWYKEFIDKVVSEVFYGDPFIKWENKAILPALGPNTIGPSNLDIILSELRACPYINPDFVLPIGPEWKLQEALSGEHRLVIPQGDNITDNFFRGVQALDEMGYEGKYFAIIPGDSPLPRAENYKNAIETWKWRCNPDMEVFCGLVRKDKVIGLIEKEGLQRFGTARTEIPFLARLWGHNLHKYGVRYSDYDGMCAIGERPVLVYSNFLIFNREALKRPDARERFSHLYDFKRVVMKIWNWPKYIREFGPSNIYSFVTGKMATQELERMLDESERVKVKLFLADPIFALDIDNKPDWLRAAQYIADHRSEYAYFKDSLGK